MSQLAISFVANCLVCQKDKKTAIRRRKSYLFTPIPSHLGETLHIDIFSTDRKLFLTCIDKFSNFAIVQLIDSRTITDIEPAMMQFII